MTAPIEHDHQPQTSEVIVGRVRSRIDDLRTPRTTKARQWVSAPGGDRLVRREVQVTLPPLVVQLAQPIPDPNAGRGASGNLARPPASLEGTDALRTITHEARYLAGRILGQYAAQTMPGVRVSMRPQRLADALEVLHRYASEVDRDTLLDLDAAVRRWWAHARVVTTWDSPPLKPWVPCPGCRKIGSVQVIEAPLVMVCLDCGGAWDGTEIELEAVYRLAFAEPEDTPRVEAMLDGEAAQA